MLASSEYACERVASVSTSSSECVFPEPYARNDTGTVPSLRAIAQDWRTAVTKPKLNLEKDPR
ncbi:MAG: hypothetical protein ACOYKN_20335 [Pirellula sp.]